MGINIPDFNVRADIVPGKMLALALHPRQGRHVHVRLRHLLRRGPREDVRNAKGPGLMSIRGLRGTIHAP